MCLPPGGTLSACSLRPYGRRLRLSLPRSRRLSFQAAELPLFRSHVGGHEAGEFLAGLFQITNGILQIGCLLESGGDLAELSHPLGDLAM